MQKQAEKGYSGKSITVVRILDGMIGARDGHGFGHERLVVCRPLRAELAIGDVEPADGDQRHAHEGGNWRHLAPEPPAHRYRDRQVTVILPIAVAMGWWL